MNSIFRAGHPKNKDQYLDQGGSNESTAINIADAVTKKHAASGQFNQAIAAEIYGLTDKSIPVDADVTLIEDSAASNAKKKLSWTNIKATLKTYFDTLYGNVKYTDTRFTRVSATRDLSTASGTQEITGAGFAPKKVTIIGGVPDGVEASWGFGESGGNGAVISNSYAVSAGTFYEYTASNNVIYFIETASNYQIASISAWGSDGITLSWTKGGSITGTANIAILFER